MMSRVCAGEGRARCSQAAHGMATPYTWIAAELNGRRWDAGQVEAQNAGEAMEEIGRLLRSVAAGYHDAWRVTVRDAAQNLVCRFTVRADERLTRAS